MTLHGDKTSSNTQVRNSSYLLLVDSDANDLFYLSMLLQRFEYNICTAKTGGEALELSSVSIPALVITELELADMNGLELMMMLKQEDLTASLPLILMTADHTPEKEQQFLLTGAFACIRKPINTEELYRAVQAAIESTPRKCIRIPTHLPVSVNNAQLDSVEGEYASVLSEEGMYIRTLKPLPPNSTVTAKIMIKGCVLTLEAMVINVSTFDEGPYKEPGMGLQLTRIAPQDQKLIRHFINEEINRGIKAL